MKQVLYFSAPWCAPCKALKPKLDAIRNQIRIVDINVDASPDTAQTWNVRNVPTVIVVNGSTETGRMVGSAININAITEMFNR
jgi:thioredoxin 1